MNKKILIPMIMILTLNSVAFGLGENITFVTSLGNIIFNTNLITGTNISCNNVLVDSGDPCNPGGGGGAGNPFDQNLNTSDSPTFVNVTSTGWFIGNGSLLTGLAGGGDITGVNTDGPYLTGGCSSGTCSLLLTEAELNNTIISLGGGFELNISTDSGSGTIANNEILVISTTGTVDGSMTGNTITLDGTSHTVNTDTQLNESQVEAMIFDTDNTGNLTTTGFINASNMTLTSVLSCSQALETDSAGRIVCGTDATGGGSQWNITGSKYLYNNSGVLDGNETQINTSIRAEAANGVMARLGASTYSTLQNAQDIFHSAGWVNGGTIIDNGGGTVNVSTGTGLIKATDSRTAQILWFDWSASNNVTITENTTRYIGINYSGGSPVIIVKTTDSWDYNTEFFIGNVVNEAGELHIDNDPHAVGDHANFMIQRLYQTMPLERDDKAGGLVLSELGTRNIAVSTGALWQRINRFVISPIDTNDSDTFDRYYSDGSGGWTKESAQTQWDNTQYDDETGTLATMTSNRYSVQYFYIEIDGGLTSVYGQNQYTSLASAEAESPPPLSSLPDRIAVQGLLIGRIIFQKDAATTESIESVFTTTFSGSQVSDHGSLGGLSDDDHTQYLLTTGARDLTGNQSLAGFSLTDGGTYFGEWNGSVLYYLITEIDTKSEMEVIWGVTLLDNATSFGGDVSGTYDAIVVTPNSTTLDCNNITGTTGDNICTVTDTNFTPTDINTDYGAENVTATWNFDGLTDHNWSPLTEDLSLGGADEGQLRLGPAVIGVANDTISTTVLNNIFILQNNASTLPENISFIFMGPLGVPRFVLAMEGPDLATYNPRSLIVGFAASLANVDENIFCSTNFDAIDCDTGGSGADVGIQDDLQVLGAVYFGDTTNISHDNISDVSVNDHHTPTVDTNFTGVSAGGDLSGTYPSPGVVDDSHLHAAENITAGDFGAGDYLVTGNLNITQNLTIGGGLIYDNGTHLIID